MRIRSVEISGFRGLPGRHTFDLDADAAILVGANGVGKTSVFDAILWALTGKVARVGGSDQDLLSKYSPSGEFRVRLALTDGANSELRMVRRFDGTRTSFQLESAGESGRDQLGLAQMLERLWPEALGTDDPVASLTMALTRSVYLQQDLVRQFVESDAPSDRFAALSELMGTGRITELQAALERAKKSWSTVTNELSAELRELQGRVTQYDARVSALGTEGPVDPTREQWRSWWEGAQSLGVVEGGPPDAESAAAAEALDGAMKRLEALLRSEQRRQDETTALMADLETPVLLPDPNSGDLAGELDPESTNLTDAVEVATTAVETARAALLEAERLAAEIRSGQAQHREATAELHTLATLALRHIDGPCPVCGQAHDVGTTRARLERILARNGDAEERESLPATEHLAAELAQREVEAARLRSLQEASAQQERLAARRRQDIERRLERLLGAGVTGDPRELASGALQRSAARIAGLVELHQRGEGLALAIAQAGQSARRSELLAELAAVRVEASQLSETVAARSRTGDIAQAMIDELRAAASRLVSAQLEAMQPLLQRIYGRIDPHPTFRAIHLESHFPRGRGQIEPVISDTVMPHISTAPGVVLSSSQTNALAVSVFLAFNLGLPSAPLDAVLLDDPLQSLDDVNLLGVIDLLRRTKDRRQLLVSTHDGRFGQLLARKLRPVTPGQRTRYVEFKDWTRRGPTVTESDVPEQQSALVVVA